MQLELTTEVCRIPLRRRDGSVRAYALVDSEDFARYGHLRWSLGNQGYVVHNKNTSRKGVALNKQLSLHRLILGLEVGDGRESDHINGDRLDNRRSNLRIVTHAENLQNRASWGSSKYPNVHRVRGKWHVQVKLHGKPYSFGSYDDEDEAGESAKHARAMLFSHDVPNRYEGEAA